MVALWYFSTDTAERSEYTARSRCADDFRSQRSTDASRDEGSERPVDVRFEPTGAERRQSADGAEKNTTVPPHAYYSFY